MTNVTLPGVVDTGNEQHAVINRLRYFVSTFVSSASIVNFSLYKNMSKVNLILIKEREKSLINQLVLQIFVFL